MKVETQSQNWSSKLWPQPEGERVISAAARSFGAMFSCMCFFCSGDLPVPLSPSLKRNIFKITERPLRGQSKKGRDRVIFGPLGAAGATHQYVLEGPTVPSIGQQPWLDAISSACLLRFGIQSCSSVMLPTQRRGLGVKPPLRSQQVSPLLPHTWPFFLHRKGAWPGLHLFQGPLGVSGSLKRKASAGGCGSPLTPGFSSLTSCFSCGRTCFLPHPHLRSAV